MKKAFLIPKVPYPQSLFLTPYLGVCQAFFYFFVSQTVSFSVRRFRLNRRVFGYDRLYTKPVYGVTAPAKL